MKVFIFFCCFSLCTLSYAQKVENFGNLSLQIDQQEDINTLLKDRQALFGELNPSKIQTGILYDRVIPFSKIDQYSGKGSSLSSLAVLSQIYLELSKASIRNTGNKTFAQIQAAHATKENVIPIALLNYTYNKIKEEMPSKVLKQNKIKKGKMSKNSLAGETSYLLKRAFASAPLKDHTFRGNKVVFRLDEALFLSNDKNIHEIKINFDDNTGPRLVRFNEDINISYPSTGTKKISLELTTAEDSTLKSTFLLEVRALTSPEHTDIEFTSDIPYNNKLASATAYVYKSPLNPHIKNPIIILEGFDTANELFADDLYALVNQQNLAEILLSKGYDLIIVNFTDATTYIQANAMLTVKLIAYVNEQLKVGESPNIVVGPSMGGLVARYALSYMEKQQLPHQTALFVSFDTPHQGANIPLGDQYWVGFFASHNAAAAGKLSQINSIAAQQMLVYHQLSFPYPNPLRQNLVNELKSLGYPQTCRNIAISNGTATGIGQPYSPGDPLLSWRYRHFWVDIDGNTWAVPDVEPLTQITYCRLNKLGPWDSSLRVQVRGTSPYDTAPGGTRATNQQIADTEVRQGDIHTQNPNHCFIPTISSLDIETENLFYNIQSDQDILCKTPFQAIYYPISTNPAANQEHVSITAESVTWIMNELQFVNNPMSEAMALRVNFQNSAATPPSGWIKDEGQRFSEQAQGGKIYSYGWKRRDTGLPVDLSGREDFSSGNGARRSAPCSILQATLIYMQGNQVQNFSGVPVESYWEIAVENGIYQVTVSVGDNEANLDTGTENYIINIEGVNAIAGFLPQGEAGSDTRFNQASINVTVVDGLLTLDADGGTNTKINYVIIQPLNIATSNATSIGSQAKMAAKQPVQKITHIPLSAYPNPFVDKIKLRNLHFGKTHVTLYDMIGKKYYEATYQVNTEEFVIDLSAIEIKSGIYLLKMLESDGSSQIVRVIKK